MAKRISSNVVSLLSILLLVGCTGISLPPPLASPPAPDPHAIYRQALLPDQQDLLDKLGPLPEYRIAVRANPEDLTLTGSLEVSIPARSEGAAAEEYYFRLYPNLAHYAASMSIDLVTVNGQGAPFSYTAADTAVHITVPPSTIMAGEPATVGLKWRLQALLWPDERYSIFGKGHDVFSLPLFYPILAVRDPIAPDGWRLDLGIAQGDAAFSQMALYRVTVTVPEGYAVASTGSVQAVTRSANPPPDESGQPSRQWMDWHIVAGPVREVALFVSDQYRLAEADAYGVHINSWYLPGDEVTGRAAAEYTAAALRVYSDLFGPYPYTELDVVAGPINYRGMEYPGLFELGVDLYRTHADELEFRIAHEVAHQWWYNLVGNDPVNVPWLDEGLAEFSTYFYQQKIGGQASAEQLVSRRWQAPYDALRNMGLDAVTNQPVDAFYPNNYETIIYGKAALFHHTLMQTMGEDAYLDLLRRYLQRFRGQEVTADDFLALLKESGRPEAVKLYEKWILEIETPTAEGERSAGP